MFVVGASKKHQNSRKRRSRYAKKSVRFVYFYDEDGSFHSKRVSFFKFYWYKLQKKKLKRCLVCKVKYIKDHECY